MERKGGSVTIQPRDWFLYGQVVTSEHLLGVRRRVRDRIIRTIQDEKGQTPTEYLMIVGLMAAVIVLVFVTFFWGNVKGAASSWVGKVKDSILGTSIK